LWEALDGAAVEVLGAPLERAGLNAWADSGLTQGAGIPTIMLGPLGGTSTLPTSGWRSRRSRPRRTCWMSPRVASSGDPSARDTRQRRERSRSPPSGPRGAKAARGGHAPRSAGGPGSRGPVVEPMHHVSIRDPSELRPRNWFVRPRWTTEGSCLR
jgi:hypothetical protein